MKYDTIQMQCSLCYKSYNTDTLYTKNTSRIPSLLHIIKNIKCKYMRRIKVDQIKSRSTQAFCFTLNNQRGIFPSLIIKTLMQKEMDVTLSILSKILENGMIT